MQIFEHSIQTEATPSQIWQVLQDVENWNSWDHGIEFSRINGLFEAGTSGSMKPLDGPVLQTLLTYVEPPKIFVQEARLLLAKTIMTHSISEVNGNTQVTFKTEIKGPFAFLYARLIGPSIKKKIPIEMREMLKKAQLQKR